MHIKTRRILFWVAVFLFFAVAFITIRYAQGYVYDFDASRFVRTGGIAVQANTDAKLFVDDEFAGSLSLVTHSAGKTRLLPGSHSIRLVRDGWSAWSKEIIVQEGLLTDFAHVLLVRTDEEGVLELREEASRSLTEAFTLPYRTASVSSGDWLLDGSELWLQDGTASPSLVAERVIGFQPENDRVVWWTRNEVWVYWTDERDERPDEPADQHELLGRWSVPLVGAAWFRDRFHVVIDLGVQGYRVLETDTRGGNNIIRF